MRTRSSLIRALFGPDDLYQLRGRVPLQAPGLCLPAPARHGGSSPTSASGSARSSNTRPSAALSKIACGLEIRGAGNLLGSSKAAISRRSASALLPSCLNRVSGVEGRKGQAAVRGAGETGFLALQSVGDKSEAQSRATGAVVRGQESKGQESGARAENYGLRTADYRPEHTLDAPRSTLHARLPRLRLHPLPLHLRRSPAHRGLSQARSGGRTNPLFRELRKSCETVSGPAPALGLLLLVAEPQSAGE